VSVGKRAAALSAAHRHRASPHWTTPSGGAECLLLTAIRVQVGQQEERVRVQRYVDLPCVVCARRDRDERTERIEGGRRETVRGSAELSWLRLRLDRRVPPSPRPMALSRSGPARINGAWARVAEAVLIREADGCVATDASDVPLPCRPSTATALCTHPRSWSSVSLSNLRRRVLVRRTRVCP